MSAQKQMHGGGRGGQLFDDKSQGHPRLRGLGYGTVARARNSVRRLRKMPYAYQIQAGQAMYYRAKYRRVRAAARLAL